VALSNDVSKRPPAHLAFFEFMLEDILPDAVIAVESRSDPPGLVLFPSEQAALGRAVDKRRLEFTTARACARTALARLGLPSLPVTSGERGEPQWPAGVVGSITHCDGYRACAVARSTEIVTIGIDAERNAPLPDGVLPAIARTEELPGLRNLRHDIPGVHWDRLLFSAKESVYKAWYPLTKHWLGFEDAFVTVDPFVGTFCARLVVSGPRLANRRLEAFSGRFLVRDGLVLTAIALAAAPVKSRDTLL
jgi:4'-phosphopantetheinyl transferase EntD